MPCRRAYWPLKSEARLTAQMEVVTKQLENRTPCPARRSRFGVRMTGSPMQPRAFQRRSSARRKTRFIGLVAARGGAPRVGAAPMPLAPSSTRRETVLGLTDYLLKDGPDQFDYSIRLPGAAQRRDQGETR